MTEPVEIGDDKRTVAAILKELSDIVASLGDSQKVLDSLVGLVTRMLAVDRCSLMLIDPDSEELRIRAAHHLKPEVVRNYRARPGEGIAGWVALNGKPLLIKDLSRHDAFSHRGASQYKNKSLLSVPLLFREKVVGVLNVNNKLDGAVFTESDQLLLGAVANFAVNVLEKAKLRELAREKKRIDADLRLARETQAAFLPTALPSDADVQFAAYNRSAAGIAGDFHDVMTLRGRDTCIVLGDVCGKGIASALYMARVLGYFRAAAGSNCSPGELLTQVNRFVATESSALAFVTACMIVINERRNTLAIYNAGHLPPYLYNERTKTLRVVKGARGFPLGVDENGVYEGASLALESGDSLVLYTDGITEAKSVTGEFFGPRRLEAAIYDHKGSAEDLVERIRCAVQDFAGDERQADDQTLLVAKRA